MELNRKLTTGEKLEILRLSGEKSLRELAKQYSVHHSTIDEIIKESMSLLSEYWDEKAKKKGRPRKNVSQEEQKLKELQKELHGQKVETAIAEMTLDYYKLVMESKGIENPYAEKNKHFKKKKKKQ